jgi:hypothetical protein
VRTTPPPFIWGFVVIVYVLSFLTFLQQGEDSYITFRYLEQFISGRGLVFNAGERVEGYSNLLWLLVLAPFAWVGLPLHVVSQFLATTAFAALVPTAWWIAERLRLSAGRWLLPALITFEPLLHYHDDRGLETVPYAAAIAGALLLVGGGGSVLVAGSLGAAAALFRPEGILFACALGSTLLWSEGRFPERLRRLAIYLAPIVLVFVAQMIFRRFYYGEWVPNTVIAKSSGGGGGTLQLVAYTTTRLGLPALAAVGFLLALRQKEWRVLALGGLALHVAAILFQLRAGGLLNEGFRYLAPLFPLTAVGLALGVASLWEDLRFPAAIAFLLLHPILLFSEPQPGEPWLLRGNGNAPRSLLHVRVFEAGTYNIPARLRHYLSPPQHLNADAGRWTAANLPEGVLLAGDQLGQWAFFAGKNRPVVDLLGLMDRHVARHGVSAEYLLDRTPKYIILESCLDTFYWPEVARLQPHVPHLRTLMADPQVSSTWRLRWMLRPRLSFAQLGFGVWVHRSVDDGQPLEEVRVGLTDSEFERAWRVLGEERK